MRTLSGGSGRKGGWAIVLAAAALWVAPGRLCADLFWPLLQASYAELLSEYPLVVVGSWDDAECKAKSADKDAYALDRLTLRVHRVLKGQCPDTVDVKLANPYSLRRGVPDGWGGVRFAWPGEPPPADDAELWSVCISSQRTNPGSPTPGALFRDARRPAVYFLRREIRALPEDDQQDGPSLLSAPPQTDAPDFTLRGRQWQPLPFPLLKPPATQPDARDSAPAPAREPAGPPARTEGEPPGPRTGGLAAGQYVIERLGEIQPALMADGFAALLAGRQPDTAFAALQEWFEYHRRGAVRELNESADRAAWGRLIEEAVAWTRFACLYPARSAAALGELLVRVQEPNAYRYENLWDFAFNCDYDRAFAEAARLLADPKSPPSARRMLIGRIVAHAPRSDGGAEAAVLARRLDDEHPPISQTARDSLVNMLVDRGGRHPGGPNTAWSHCRPGALDRFIAALKRELGEEGYQRMLDAHPALAVAVVPRKARSPWYDSPANTGEFPEALDKFAGGRLAAADDTAAWQKLYEHWHQPFALEAMVRGLVLDWSGVNDWPRHQCMEGLIRRAILWPDRVRAALAGYDGYDSPHLQAVRCYVVPGYDARVFADRLRDWGYPAVIGQAVAWTENGQALIGRLLGDPASDIRGNHSELRRLAERWYGPEFVQRMLPPTMRDEPPATPSDEERAEAVRLLTELIAQAAGRTPLSFSRKQFEPYEKAARVLIRARDRGACEVLAGFLSLRPYQSQALYWGAFGPAAWDSFYVLSAILACDSPLYFRTVLDLADDPDWWWGERAWNHLLGELTGGHAAGESLPAVVKALADRPHMAVPDIRVEMLRLLGVAIGEPRSKAGIEALTAALVGRPGVPLVEYSRGHDDDLIRSLAETVLADRFGPRASAAYGVVRQLPEPRQASALSAALVRLAPEGTPPPVPRP